MVNELDYGMKNHCSREATKQITQKHDYKTEDPRNTTMIEGKLKRPVVKLAPLFYECFPAEKQGRQC